MEARARGAKVLAVERHLQRHCLRQGRWRAWRGARDVRVVVRVDIAAGRPSDLRRDQGVTKSAAHERAEVAKAVADQHHLCGAIEWAGRWLDDADPQLREWLNAHRG